MAIAASNQDQNIGGPTGCVGTGSYIASGRHIIIFTGLTGTITMADPPMFTPDFDNITTPSHLLVVRQSTLISGPDPTVLGIDGGHTNSAPRTVGTMLINSAPSRPDVIFW